MCLFKYAEYCNFSSWKGFTPDALLFSVCTALCAPVQRAWHGCWCVIPSDIIVLSIHDISNAWITRRSVVSAAHASNEIVLFPLRVSFLSTLSHLRWDISISVKTEHVSGQSPAAKLNFAVNIMPTVSMWYANCSQKKSGRQLRTCVENLNN